MDHDGTLAYSGIGGLIRSMRGKLIGLFVLLSLVPLTATLGMAFFQSKNSQQSVELERFRDNTQLYSGFVDSWIREREDNMVVVAGTARVRTMDKTKIGDAVKQYFDQWGVYESMGVYDLKGDALYRTDSKQASIQATDYFQQAAGGTTVISAPFLSPDSGKVVFAVAAPIVVDKKTVGVMGGILPVDQLLGSYKKLETASEGETYIINKEGYVITATQMGDDTWKSGLSFKVDSFGVEQALAGKPGASIYTNYAGNEVAGAYFSIGNTGWSLLSEQDTAVAFEELNGMRQLILWSLLGFAVLVIVISLLVSNSLTQPIRQMAGVAQRLAGGDVEQTVDYHSKDEMGYLAEAFRTMIDFQKAMVMTATAVADGDLSVEVKPKSERDRFGHALNVMIESLRGTITQVADSASSVEDSAGKLAQAAEQAGLATSQIANTIQQVARGTTQQSAGISRTAESVEVMSRMIGSVSQGSKEQAVSVNQSAAITEQISTTILKVADNAQAVTRESAEAARYARTGAQTVADTIKVMESIKQKVGQSAVKVRELGTRSDQIGAIVETIDDIAAQTNLLALNAAIEAARAGEHGKGFAVVADEVRKLAERSSSATREVASLIKGIQVTVGEAVASMNDGAREVEKGVAQAGGSGTALEEILKAAESVYQQAEQAARSAASMSSAANELVSSMDMVSRVAEENASTAQEMSGHSNTVTQEIENIASVSEENSAAVEEVSASAQEMNTQVEQVTAAAQSLAEMASALQEIVAQFNLAA
jgi:methyl-accepting chemotaxis protein